MVYARTPGSTVPDLPLAVAKILELIDGARRIDEIFEAAQISAEKGLAVVRKLSRLGIIETAPARPIRTQLSDSSTATSLERAETLRGLPTLRSFSPGRAAGQGFSPAEEAFFASEVEPGLEEEEPENGLGHRLSLLISDFVLYLRRDVAL
jgi:hypothetical protein